MRISQSTPLSLVLVCVGYAVASAAGATHLDVTYSYLVDRFVIDRGGSGDFVDEFDDGSLSPWSSSFGAPYEDAAGSGFAVLADPGSDFYGDGFILSERTGIVLTGQGLVGSGDFTVTSEWTPVLPAFDQGILMVVQEVTLPGTFPLRNNILLLSNTAAGLQAFQVVNDDPGASLGDDATISFESVMVDAGDLNTSSNIVLRADFDNATGKLTFSFRIDGSTFVAPFSALDMTSENVSFTLDAAAVPEPSAVALLSAGIGAAAMKFRRRKMAYRSRRG